MVLIEVRRPDGAVLSVETGRQIGPRNAAERLRVPDDIREGKLDPPEKPSTWEAWIQANPGHPLAQLRDAEPNDPQKRQYIYDPHGRYRLVSGTCMTGEDKRICAARELWEETGLDVRPELERLVPIRNIGDTPAFRVEATDAECSAIEQLLTQRIAERKGEVFAFRWDAPGARQGARRKTKRSKRSRRTRRR